MILGKYKGLWRPSILLPTPTQSVCGFRQVASPYETYSITEYLNFSIISND
jgi:hypothetical protein